MRKIPEWESNPKGHIWETDELDPTKPNRFAMSMDMEFHNGPVCIVCGYTFCEHCELNIEECVGKTND